jgi:hypothetical protein
MFYAVLPVRAWWKKAVLCEKIFINIHGDQKRSTFAPVSVKATKLSSLAAVACLCTVTVGSNKLK